MILDEIIERTKADLEIRQKDIPLDLLGRTLASNPFAPRDVKPFLTATKEEPIRIIAEVKKASPSKGIIKEDFNPMEIAQAYSNSGANAISVLTEPHYFQGNLEYLTAIRRYVPTPLLRKDFIVDKYQIVEALVYGADFILLIAKALGTKEMKELYEYALHLGLEVLVEIHDKEDLTKAIKCGASIIGINHRNLDTFEMDMELCDKLIPMIPNGKIIVAESGVSNVDTIKRLSGIGADAFLIGEHFMRQASIEDEVTKFKNSLN
ncbi:indole-3-glycerol phosphate synthase TrpC [Poseidonibacter ostreae]|uniref:Indole-3-glycerol phosphate synthase n=1 Tax=Poseidonibacter ostreae TaxID=2654171 RepID=A0A6L4WNQ1_9BACT|nr:indole-3-glycerol phosphate synthase TrpC [Poseidonibacter ostreae]KAB7885174.1 indole-3-glycerol phosphate synthase TrpC [Poseidonibacter ostreae]KAB7885760.1 indole-3-glycerol phosphate synthase TrpC [Poseidonibacter ostreae]KAB7893011.1 indole-3-glycerol phosphate synthase TrpC [Poseidonibacter ostreae]MAC84793.1 indole-3-glycerol phosphate synthase [Arcobacter sp.]